MCCFFYDQCSHRGGYRSGSFTVTVNAKRKDLATYILKDMLTNPYNVVYVIIDVFFLQCLYMPNIRSKM